MRSTLLVLSLSACGIPAGGGTTTTTTTNTTPTTGTTTGPTTTNPPPTTGTTGGGTTTTGTPCQTPIVFYDGIDQDCDGLDECDQDGDGVDGDGPNKTDGFCDWGTDCDDLNPAVNPNAAEICDGVDNNCDGQVDEGLDATLYADADGDGFGDPNAPVNVACGQIAGAGLVVDNTDCNDDPATGVNTFPGSAENNSLTLCEKDDDQDGWGDAYPYTLPPGVTAGTDCNDSPGCVVSDCSILDPTTGLPLMGNQVYYNPDPLHTEDNHLPGNDYPETCEPNVDDDGDGYCDALDQNGVDDNGDGIVDNEPWCFGGLPAGDCENPDPAVSYDDNPNVNPGVAEICDGIDNNCDGVVDENCGLPACAADQSRMKFIYTSEAGATGIIVSTEQNNTGMLPITEGSPAGWHMTSTVDAAGVTTVTVWNDACTMDNVLWQASASFVGGWSCMGNVFPFTTHGTWQVYEDGVLGSTIYVLNGIGGCELQVN